MSDLIFVPELGLISGTSLNLNPRIWYPKPPLNKLQLKSTSKPKKFYMPSPFNRTQQALTLRNRTRSPKKNMKFLSGLEAFVQPRPAMTNKKKKLQDLPLQNDKFFPSGLELALHSRPMTIANANRKLSNDFENEIYVNLPSLQQRPQRPIEI